MLLAIGIACSLCNQVKLDPEFFGETRRKKLKFSKLKNFIEAYMFMQYNLHSSTCTK